MWECCGSGMAWRSGRLLAAALLLGAGPGAAQTDGTLGAAVMTAYLLCRIADTIEDDGAMSAARKAELFDAKVRAGGDAGVPIVVGAPDSEHAKIFMDLAVKVAGRVAAHVLSGPRRVSALVTIR